MGTCSWTGRLAWLMAVSGLVVACGCGGAQRAPKPGAGEPVQKGPFRQDVAWSPDGKWLAYSEYDGREPFDVAGYAIWIAAADGSERRRVVDHAMYVSWSPDGGRIAFGAEREGNWDVYTVDAGGGNLRRVTHDAAKDRQPSWSPDGRSIAFVSDRSENADIYVVSVEGGEPRRLTADGAKDFGPSWSPDGKDIVFYREKGDGQDQVCEADAQSGEVRAITNDQMNNVFPGYLPDGRIGFIAGGKDREESLMVWDGGKTSKVNLGRERAFFARWSPDGERIAYITGGWPRSVICVGRARGGGGRTVVE